MLRTGVWIHRIDVALDDAPAPVSMVVDIGAPSNERLADGVSPHIERPDSMSSFIAASISGT